MNIYPSMQKTGFMCTLSMGKFWMVWWHYAMDTMFWYACKLILYYPADWLHFIKATHAKPTCWWWVWASVDWEGGRIFSFMTCIKQGCVWMGIQKNIVILIIFQVSNVCYFAMDYVVAQHKGYAHGLHILWILLCLNTGWFFPYHSS